MFKRREVPTESPPSLMPAGFRLREERRERRGGGSEYELRRISEEGKENYSVYDLC